MRPRLSGADVCFTDAELTIRGAASGEMRANPTGVVSPPAVLDSLRSLSFNLLSLANNHAYELGEPGIRDTLEECRKRGFSVAGTGLTLAEAAAPGLLKTPKGTVALVAMASSALPTAAMATATHPGVHHVSVRNGAVDAADSERTLASIRDAAQQADLVIVYQHDHYWATDWQVTPEWKKAWCRACIDAGAHAFVSHGVPILHGIEIYKRRPIFYGLGNFIFHVGLLFSGSVPAQYTVPEVWQSVIADCDFQDGRVSAIRLEPITLHAAPPGASGYALHGNPRPVAGVEATEILERLKRLSKDVGTEVVVAGGKATVRL